MHVEPDAVACHAGQSLPQSRNGNVLNQPFTRQANAPVIRLLKSKITFATIVVLNRRQAKRIGSRIPRLLDGHLNRKCMAQVGRNLDLIRAALQRRDP